MTNLTTPHPLIGINGQLLSAAQSYRSAGVSGYIRQLLLHLPAVAPDLNLLAFVPAATLSAQPGLALHSDSRWDTTHPWRRILWEQSALPWLAARQRLALLHNTVNVSPLLAPCPQLITVHDLAFMRYPQAFRGPHRRYLQSQVRRSVRRARAVIAVSEATKRDLVTFFGVSPERVTVIYNGVDAAFTPAPAEAVAAFRARKALPERFLLHLGTLEPRKNLTRLVQAFARVRTRDTGQPRLKLVLAGGKGWSYDSIFAEVERLGLADDVLFPGYIDDRELADWYRAATLFVYPSLMEGFGLPVLEAMACGAVVVTSNVSSLPEVAGNAALLVDPTDVEALAEALLGLLHVPELAAELRARSVQQAARFSWQRTAEQTAALYRRMLDDSGGKA
ncbi:MAG: glycosyltransferase family 1 protein [Caldilineales bacterium]